MMNDMNKPYEIIDLIIKETITDSPLKNVVWSIKQNECNYYIITFIRITDNGNAEILTRCIYDIDEPVETLIHYILNDLTTIYLNI